MQVNITSSEKRKIENLADNDAWFNAMLTADYSEVDTFVDNQITDIANVQKLLKLMLKILMFLFRKQVT